MSEGIKTYLKCDLNGHFAPEIMTEIEVINWVNNVYQHEECGAECFDCIQEVNGECAKFKEVQEAINKASEPDWSYLILDIAQLQTLQEQNERYEKALEEIVNKCDKCSFYPMNCIPECQMGRRKEFLKIAKQALEEVSR